MTKEFLKELFVPQVMARGFNPNAAGAGPRGCLLVQGQTWSATASSRTVRETQWVTMILCLKT